MDEKHTYYDSALLNNAAEQGTTVSQSESEGSEDGGSVSKKRKRPSTNVT